MKSNSIDWLYTKLDKSIRLAQSYTEISELSFIIKSCRLKPYEWIFNQEKPDKIILYKWWFDEFGNSLEIIKNKRILITYNDLRLDRDKIVCTDLYHGLSLDRITKISKLVLVSTGKDEDLYQDCCILTFLGLDNYLRSYLYWNKEWQPVSPLLIGMKWLKYIENNLDIKYFLEMENKKNSPLPCVSGRSWLSCLPPAGNFLSLLGKQHEWALPIFTKE